MTTTTSTTTSLKDEGDQLYSQKDFANAITKFTEAIELDGGSNAVLFANRAACHLGLKHYCLEDAQKAVQLDGNYAKAWVRLGAAHEGLYDYAECIESYRRAITILKNSGSVADAKRLRKEVETELVKVTANIMNRETMSPHVIVAMARAHDIQVPLPHTPANRNAIANAAFHHPRFNTQPPLRLLLIPQSQTEPLQQIELPRDGDVKQRISQLLGCALHDAVVLHSEDQVARAQGKRNGVGIGRMHTSYEAFMDDNAVATRPLNRRACELLHRPRTFGPILVMKTTFIKIDPDACRTEDILCWEKVTEEELKGERYKKLREEWLGTIGPGELPTILEFRPM